MLDKVLIAFAGGAGVLAVLNWRETKRDRTIGNMHDVILYRRVAVWWGACCAAAVIGASL